MKIRAADIVMGIIVALLLMSLREVNAQPNYVPGTSTTPGAYIGGPAASGWAIVTVVNPLYRCPQARPVMQPCELIGYQVGADYAVDGTRYRVYGQSKVKYSIGSQVLLRQGALQLQ